MQSNDEGNYIEWKEVGGRESAAGEKEDLKFANLVCKHLKSNAIALVKNKQLIGKGCGQTSRIDSLRQAIEKAKQFNADINGAVMASFAKLFPDRSYARYLDDSRDLAKLIRTDTYRVVVAFHQ